MDVFEAIRHRRSIGKVRQEAVDREKIERILEAAVWAPNHYHTEPWSFFVLTGEGRNGLGRTLAAIAKDQAEDPDDPEVLRKVKVQEQKAMRAPVIIAVAMKPDDRDKVPLIEEIAATSAAIQNMLLAAHALGLGAIWRTGQAAYHPLMKRYFGLGERDEILGFVYIGYPDMKTPGSKRIPWQQKTTWVEADRGPGESHLQMSADR